MHKEQDAGIIDCISPFLDSYHTRHKQSQFPKIRQVFSKSWILNHETILINRSRNLRDIIQALATKFCLLDDISQRIRQREGKRGLGLKQKLISRLCYGSNIVPPHTVHGRILINSFCNNIFTNLVNSLAKFAKPVIELSYSEMMFLSWRIHNEDFLKVCTRHMPSSSTKFSTSSTMLIN